MKCTRLRNAPTLSGVVNMINSASPMNVPKRPSASTMLMALAPSASKGRSARGSGRSVMQRYVDTRPEPRGGNTLRSSGT